MSNVVLSCAKDEIVLRGENALLCVDKLLKAGQLICQGRCQHSEFSIIFLLSM